MLIRSRAPIRIDLAGGWTDVPPFAEREGGAVVNLAISRYTYVSLRRRENRSVRLHSEDYRVTVEAADIADLAYDGALDLVKAALIRVAIDHVIEITTRSDAPPGSGLGTSAAMGVAVTGALAAIDGALPSRHQLAALATALEVDELAIAGGKQDQLASALGGANFLEFGPGSPTVTPLPMSIGVMAEIEKRLVLCYSGLSRLSGDIIQRVQEAYRAGEPATCDALRAMQRLARSAREALTSGAIEELGPILQANWRCQQALHSTVSNADIDRLFSVAERHGSIGGKACGAGGGGCIVFLAAPESDRSLRVALAEAGARLIDYSLDRSGLQTWRIDEATGRVLSE